jgi:hypothetical protein
MAANDDDSARVRKLLKFFHDVTSGLRSINTPANAKLFLEAVPYKKPPNVCVELLVSSVSGLEAIRRSVRADITLEFVTSHTLPLLNFLSNPEIKLLADGHLLARLLEAIVSPPTFWNALVALFLDRQLPDDSLRPFAWLVLEAVSLLAKLGINLLDDVQAIEQNGGLMDAASHEIREFGYKIRKVLQTQSAPAALATETQSPGGRHDNDFTDFRKIAIFPTADEFLSTEKPYYRYMSEVFGHDLGQRTGVHLDNQFRLLREDMLGELREDLQVAMGKKKGRTGAIKLSDLVPIDIDPGDGLRAKPCSLSLECQKGLETLQKMKPVDRKAYLEQNRNFIKHQTFGALCQGQTIYGFAFIDRDITSLAKSPPVIKLQFTDGQALAKSLMAVKSNIDLQFVVIDTPIYAYQPVLEGIKNIRDLPLQDQLLDPESEAIALNGNPLVSQKCIHLQYTKKRLLVSTAESRLTTHSASPYSMR